MLIRRSAPLLLLSVRAFCSAASISAPKRVVFLGTPSVAARSLELLLAGARAGRGGGFDIAAVVSQPPKPTGRKKKLTPSPVHELAEKEGLNLLTPPDAKDEAFLTALADLEPDLCITAAYGCFLPQRFLDLPAFGTLNIHPSLLPLYRGAAPVQRCLEAGDATTGVTVAFTVLAMDAGPVLRQVQRPLGGDEPATDLLLELFETGTEQLLEALPSVWDGSCESLIRPQDGSQATKVIHKRRALALGCRLRSPVWLLLLLLLSHMHARALSLFLSLIRSVRFSYLPRVAGGQSGARRGRGVRLSAASRRPLGGDGLRRPFHS